MEKTTTMNLTVNPELKRQAEDVLGQLGISMSAAVNLYLHQIVLNGGSPFLISLPKAPAAINADQMAADELHRALMAGYEDMQAGNVLDAAAVFAAFHEAHA